MIRKVSIVPVMALLVLASACLHKSGGAAVTPWEKVHTYNAALAETNNAVEHGAEAAVSSNLLQPAQATPIINMTGQVALLHQQITALLAQGQATTANMAGVKSLVDQIKVSIANLPPAALGIKNPKSAQTFEADVSSIGSIADAILSSLQATGVSP